MTLLRRLSLCLLALALLPGASLQARMAMAMPGVVVEGPAERNSGSSGGCHDAKPAASARQALPALHAVQDGVDPGCCGDGASSPDDCDHACSCPSVPPALSPSMPAIAFAVRDPRWIRSGLHGRDRFAEGPPSRPPIG